MDLHFTETNEKSSKSNRRIQSHLINHLSISNTSQVGTYFGNMARRARFSAK